MFESVESFRLQYHNHNRKVNVNVNVNHRKNYVSTIHLYGDLGGNEVENVESDAEFEKMKAEIEALMSAGAEGSADATMGESKSTELIESNDFGSNPILRKSIAVCSTFLGAALYFFQPAQTVSGVELLHTMEKESVSLKEAVCNGKPTLVEFYADWCESCKVLAPTMRAMEFKYKNDVNFITVNGVDPKNANLVSGFGVDGIPHVAFITKDAKVLTALVGAVPGSMLNSEISALAMNKDLPYEGYDAFAQKSPFPFGSTQSICSAKE